jgi:D-sedoheptulose 7-phosphate isomerase
MAALMTASGPRFEVARARVRAILDESSRVTRATSDVASEVIVAGAQLLVDTLRNGGKVLAFGNGGSAADAQHLSAELAGRFERERPALPALALTANSSEVTAIGNDYGFERSFSRLIEAHGLRGDLAVAISTSGNSPNVLAAVEEARSRGLRALALCGRGGGKLAPMADVAVVVPSDVTARIQEAHGAVIHVLCELVEEALFADSASASSSPAARG